MMFVLGSVVVACSAKVPRLPLPGESLLAQAFTTEIGGKGFNLALGASRLGAEVNGLLPVGQDSFTQLIEAALTQTDLPLTMLRRFPGSSGCGVGFIDDTGENCLAVYPGANSCLGPADVHSAADVLRRAELVVAQFEIGDQAIIEAFRIARINGIRTLLNPSPFRRVDPDILKLTSILVLNQVEALDLTGAHKIGLAADEAADPAWWRSVLSEILERGPEMIVLTLGRQGAIALFRTNAPVQQPAFKVDAVDTLGAGDSFAAGFAVSTLEGRPIADCLNRAAACGALTVQKLGVFGSLPVRHELEDFLLRMRN